MHSQTVKTETISSWQPVVAVALPKETYMTAELFGLPLHLAFEHIRCVRKQDVPPDLTGVDLEVQFYIMQLKQTCIVSHNLQMER